MTSGPQATLDGSDAAFGSRCREEVQRILASRTFCKSSRLRSLLEYIGECSIEGRFDDLSEQQIGIAVFQRAPGYDSADDTIVRVTARHLRERLGLYYREEGLANQLQMAVPKGSYVATFQLSSTAVLLPNASGGGSPVVTGGSRIADDPEPPAGWPLSARLAVAACAILALTLPAVVYFLLHSRPELPGASAGPASLWRALFTTGRRTLIVPGDASLDAYIAWEQRAVSLKNYTEQDYQREIVTSRPPSGMDVPLSVRSVTPMADLRLVSELVRVPERMRHPEWEDWIDICYARDVTVANTHDNNLILIGSETFNPWVTLYQPQLDFHVHWDYKTDLYTVTNRAPRTGEKSSYQYDRRIPGSKALTLIALTDNSQGQGRVLLVEGTTMGATYGAVDFLTDKHLWSPVITAATDRSGRLHNFEVLLSNDFVRGGISNTQIIAIHLH